ncbi:MAG: dihydroorotate dehydrogenase electron transfer subunit [Clostridiaceae bacterium]|nr:dihydroorotate dehydrogenase electron transfer subunit [Eubacteriales bacterium]
MLQQGIILENQKIAKDVFRMRLHAGDIAAQVKPGQFIMLKCWEGYDPLLMRPFSVNSADGAKQELVLLYKVVGKGTRLMADLRPGDETSLLGPLGNGFPLAGGAKRIALIGRGIGMAPLRLLAQRALEGGTLVHAYLSASSPEQLYDREVYEALNIPVSCTVCSGELVTDLFAKDLRTMKFDAAYLCGSRRLMRETDALADAYGFEAYVSVEEHMACGVGACKSCACALREQNGEVRNGYVCKDGPVFAIKRLVAEHV